MRQSVIYSAAMASRWRLLATVVLFSGAAGQARAENTDLRGIDARTFGELSFDFLATLVLGLFLGLVLNSVLASSRLHPLKKVALVIFVGPWVGFMILNTAPPALGGLGRGLGWLVAMLAL